MLKKYLLIASLPFLLNAQSVDTIVSNTLENNYSLKALESSISEAQEQITLASKWENPILSLGVNDVQFNDISKRDIEAMQAYFVGVTQAIPVSNRLDIQKNIAQNDYSITKYQLQNEKLEIQSKIYEYIYKIKLLEQRLALFEEFKSNVKRLESLLTKFYEYGKANQKDILNTKILYSELTLKAKQLQTLLNTNYLKLEEITYEKITSIDLNMNIQPIELPKDIQNHPQLLLIKESSNKFENVSSLEKEKKLSDIKVKLTYFDRADRFEDYVNFSVAFPLSIYDKENIKAAKAKYKSMQFKNKEKDLRFKFSNKIETLQKNIDDALTTYSIIKKEILPKYEELEKILENDNSYLKQKVDTSSLIKNQNELIKYKLKAIDEKDKYFTALAKSYYFTRIEK